jgi:hypothetical protein
MRFLLVMVIIYLLTAHASAAEALPRSVDPRIKIELFAEQPQLVTPTGIDVDHRGRVWVIESNTHFRPDGYKGHPSDRLLILRDADGDGRADEITTFADGFTHTMSVAVRPVWMDVVRVERDESEESRVENGQGRAERGRNRPQRTERPRPTNLNSRLSTLHSRLKCSSPRAAKSYCSKTPTATTCATAAPCWCGWKPRATIRTTGWRGSRSMRWGGCTSAWARTSASRMC